MSALPYDILIFQSTIATYDKLLNSVFLHFKKSRENPAIGWYYVTVGHVFLFFKQA